MSKQRGFVAIFVIIVAILIISIVIFSTFFVKKTHTSDSLAGGNCKGSGPVILSVLPMKVEDIGSIIPYGWMVGPHVTPIDHQYFTPKDWDSPRDSYEVRAPADGHIIQIQHRTSDYSVFTHGKKTDEYRIVIDYTCTFLSYFDLITSLSPDIKLNAPVKAGQVIGKIGGQTLDFAVWDTTKTLPGFLVPDHYSGEAWKIHTADPLDYASPEVKNLMLSLNPRKVQPISGKIDYDIDGTLSGNWFLKGSGGYNNNQNNPDYWKGQFAFAPNNYDPTLWEISSGAWGENAGQFAINSSAPRPDNVSVAGGLVKYELFQIQFLADGKPIENERTISGSQTITAKAGKEFMGCMLVQLTAKREMKAEGFPRQSCENVNGFTSNAKIYER